MLGDIDRQQSSREWLGIRPFKLPTIDTWEIGHDNISRPPKGTTHVVLDTTAGLHGKMLKRVLKLDAGHRAGAALVVRHAGHPPFPERTALRKSRAQGQGRCRGDRHAGRCAAPAPPANWSASSPPSTCRCWPTCAIPAGLRAGHRRRHDPVRPAALARRARPRTVEAIIDWAEAG